MKSLVIVCLIWAAAFSTSTAMPMSADTQKASIRFIGPRSADLFSREIDESFQGVIEQNFISKPGGPLPVGYVQASPAGQIWGGTMWTRDGGTLMRELAQWGYLEQAKQLANCLIDLVQKNSEGYYSFPEYFDGAKPGSGMELDGTASITIGMQLLWERLPKGDPTKRTIEQFLSSKESPVAFVCHRLGTGKLIAGTGEFGPGCGLPGEAINVVQNGLIAIALESAARISEGTGNKKGATAYRKASKTISKAILESLVDNEGKWIWCIDPKTLQPNPAIINHEINKGFGGLNGVSSMRADVLGFEPLENRDPFIEPSGKTLDGLYSFPLRKQQFDKYGIWTQFDTFRRGLATSPSYGQCYALQTMLLLDKLEMAGKGVEWLASATYDLIPGYKLPRKSPYFIHERMYSPEATGKVDLEVGCGALNLVNVTETLKVARLMLGVDDTNPNLVKLAPRLIPNWQGIEAKSWPILTESGTVHADIRIERSGTGLKVTIEALDGSIPQLAIRMPTSVGLKRISLRNVKNRTLITF